MKNLPIYLDADLVLEDEQGKICDISSTNPSELLIQFKDAKAFKRLVKTNPLKSKSFLLNKSPLLQILNVTQIHLMIKIKEELLARKAPSKRWQFNIFKLIRLYISS